MHKSDSPVLVEGSTFPALPMFLVVLIGAVACAYGTVEDLQPPSFGLLLTGSGLVAFTFASIAGGWLLLNPTNYEFYRDGFRVKYRGVRSYRYSDIEAWWPSASGTSVWMKMFGSEKLLHMTAGKRTAGGQSLVQFLDDRGTAENWVRVEGTGAKSARPTPEASEIEHDVRMTLLMQQVSRSGVAEAMWLGRLFAVFIGGVMATLFGVALLYSPEPAAGELGFLVMVLGIALLVLDYVIVWPHYADARAAMAKSKNALVSNPG